MKIYKIEGAKNTFALISYLNEPRRPDATTVEGKKVLSKMAMDICQNPQIQMDGCVFIFPSHENDFSWEFFNSDGSEALMCGNAARAVSLWHHAYVNKKNELTYQTPAQIVKAEIMRHGTWTAKTTHGTEDLEEGQVRVWLKGAKYIADDKGHKIYDSGVPHLCVFLEAKHYFSKTFEDIKKDFFAEAKSLRFPEALDDKGANVTYIWGIDLQNYEKDRSEPMAIKAMSFERGVEDWTEACGTGAIAAAYFIKDILKEALPIHVQMPGGILEIGESEGRTTLTGPAKILEVVNIDV